MQARFDGNDLDEVVSIMAFWNIADLHAEDPLNQRIWIGSTDLQAKIQAARPEADWNIDAIGAQ